METEEEIIYTFFKSEYKVAQDILDNKAYISKKPALVEYPNVDTLNVARNRSLSISLSNVVASIKDICFEETKDMVIVKGKVKIFDEVNLAFFVSLIIYR